MDGHGRPQRGPGPSPAWPTPSAAPRRLHHDSQWCWAGGARWLETQRNRRTAPPQMTCPGLPRPPHHTLGPGPICPREGQRGGEARGPGRRGWWSPGARADEEDQEQLIPFFVLCWLWRGFLGLAGRAGPLGRLGGQGHGGLLAGGGGGRREGPCRCRGLGHGGSCCRSLATHAKLVNPRGVDAVDPPLVEVDEEDHIWGWGEGAG